MNICYMYVPENSKCILGIPMIPKYITIHEAETGITDAPMFRNYMYYRNLLLHPKYNREKVGYHYIVDDEKAYAFIPDNMKAYHCGDGEFGTGNSESIGVERCVNEGIDHMKAIHIQAKLTAHIANKYSIPLTNIMMHKDWSGKDCPSRLIHNVFISWDEFISLVEKYMKED
ncbi:MAG: N-acetylmuramoyl-L-alanine amidase [Clostridia bacterium]